MYVGVWAAGGRLEASLSDGSTPVYIDTSISNPTSTTNAVYTLNYQAASPGQTLSVKWTVHTTFNAWSNVTLQAATLVGGTAPTPTPTPTPIPTPPSGEFQITAPEGFAQYVSHVAADPSGNFIVTWISFGQDGSGEGVFGRFF